MCEYIKFGYMAKPCLCIIAAIFYYYDVFDFRLLILN